MTDQLVIAAADPWCVVGWVIALAYTAAVVTHVVVRAWIPGKHREQES